MKENIDKLFILLFPIDYNNKLVVIFWVFFSLIKVAMISIINLHIKMAKKFSYGIWVKNLYLKPSQ